VLCVTFALLYLLCHVYYTRVLRVVCCVLRYRCGLLRCVWCACCTLLIVRWVVLFVYYVLFAICHFFVLYLFVVTCCILLDVCCALCVVFHALCAVCCMQFWCGPCYVGSSLCVVCCLCCVVRYMLVVFGLVCVMRRALRVVVHSLYDAQYMLYTTRCV